MQFCKACLAEINCLNNLKDENIIEMIDSFLLNRIHICMVLPRYNCCLWIYYRSVIKYKKITLKDYSFIFKSLINGLEYLESVGIIHLDMKPENILINHKSDIDSKEIQKVVISDFSSFIKYKDEINYNKDYISLYYRTPEIILRSKNISKTHKWCLACIMYEVYTKKPLFYVKSNNKLLDHKNLTVENDRLLELQCSLFGLPSEEYLETNKIDKTLYYGIKLNETKRLQFEKELEKNPYGHILNELFKIEHNKRAKFSDFKALIN
jgi:serine/threonine protein kinase